MKQVLLLPLLLLVLISAPTVEAHSGRTDSGGGHFCRTNCVKYGLTTGEYHKHNPPKPKAKMASKVQAKKAVKTQSKNTRR